MLKHQSLCRSTRVCRGMGLCVKAQGVRGSVLPEDGGVTKGVDFRRKLGDIRVIVLKRTQGQR